MKYIYSKWASLVSCLIFLVLGVYFRLEHMHDVSNKLMIAFGLFLLVFGFNVVRSLKRN